MGCEKKRARSGNGRVYRSSWLYVVLLIIGLTDTLLSNPPSPYPSLHHVPIPAPYPFTPIYFLPFTPNSIYATCKTPMPISSVPFPVVYQGVQPMVWIFKLYTQDYSLDIYKTLLRLFSVLSSSSFVVVWTTSWTPREARKCMRSTTGSWWDRFTNQISPVCN